MISRDRLIGILVLDKKKTGHYNLEDFSLLEDVTNRVAVSMEKEYLREQLKGKRRRIICNQSFQVLLLLPAWIFREYMIILLKN